MLSKSRKEENKNKNKKKEKENPKRRRKTLRIYILSNDHHLIIGYHVFIQYKDILGHLKYPFHHGTVSRDRELAAERRQQQYISIFTCTHHLLVCSPEFGYYFDLVLGNCAAGLDSETISSPRSLPSRVRGVQLHCQLPPNTLAEQSVWSNGKGAGRGGPFGRLICWMLYRRWLPRYIRGGPI
ncbi:hypothetical protein SODALDRAFT_2163 [Sodiomyces alkalinus F11]|uniref:Uncharacterized protein n=1 Tax=Sodiomyces alkalinus (strain CBS 110278 / VKM F-3762 / F11) TaxID=1314773 RepID=A0A3N2Q5H5_SODAK|nr:hypothetical protein SODALDRAFT_2163 [Sodiomyces alkalinus F11]ROT41875.1 hypothetical protein SODALDRAFT_2163 [Sodiomyces alkalinus F11]